MKWLVLLVLAGTTTVSAQPASTVAAEPRPICITGGSTCTTVLLLETTWGIKPAVIGPRGNSLGADLGLEAGLLVNVPSRQIGFGGSFGLRYVSEAEAMPFVARARYRHWLSPRTNLDVSAGALIANVNRGGNGATAQVALERSGKIALVLDVDVYYNKYYESGTAFEVGLAVKFCGLWSVPSALLTLLTAAALRGS